MQVRGMWSDTEWLFHWGQQHVWTGRSGVSGVRGLLLPPPFSLSLHFVKLLNYFGLSFCSFPVFKPELSASRDCDIYSRQRLLRQSCLCYTQESPLCVSQLSINLKPLPLLSQTIITCLDSLSVLVSLPLTSLSTPPILAVINSRLWNVTSESFVLF